MSLENVRAQIDAIDEEIVKLLARRQPLVFEAATYKTDSHAVAAPDRRARMLERLASLAEQEGVSPAIVTSVYNTLIDGFIALELKEHARLRAD